MRLRGAAPLPWSGARSRLRTQAAAVVAWAAGTAALATALYPTLAAALFAFLAGAVMVMTMRTSLRGGLAAGVAATAPLAFADLQLCALTSGVSRGDVAALLLGAGLLLASAVMADAASAAIARIDGEPPRARGEELVWTERAAMSERDAGLRRAEWELARAGECRREVALALVGLDVPDGGEEAGARLALMRAMDELLLESVTRFDVVCEHGPCERLMVLPEEAATNLVDGATRICDLATERLGRPVRMALASFPADGATVHALLTELELHLRTCRTQGITVQLCGTEPPPAAAPGPRLLLEPGEGGTVVLA